MSRKLKNLLIVIGLLFLAAATAFVLYKFLSLSIVNSLIVSVLGYCVILAIYNNYVLQKHISDMTQYVLDIQQYEKGVSDRFRHLEQKLISKTGSNDQSVAQPTETKKSALSQISDAADMLSGISRADKRENQTTSGSDENSDNIIELNSRLRTKDNQASKIKFTAGDLTKAIEQKNIELFLQPVMELPSRDIRYFEAFQRIRFKDNILASKQFMPVAEKNGKVAKLDLIALDLVFKVIRQLQREGNECPVFWNISKYLLGSKKLFRELMEQLRANQPLNRQLICEISHGTLAKLNKTQKENLAEIRDLGFEMSLDAIIPDLPGDLSVEHLSMNGMFSVYKVAATDLLRIGKDRSTSFADQIVPLAMQNEFRLIASNVDDENQSVMMIDAEIYLAQGDALMPAKAIKKEIYGA